MLDLLFLILKNKNANQKCKLIISKTLIFFFNRYHIVLHYIYLIKILLYEEEDIVFL